MGNISEKRFLRRPCHVCRIPVRYSYVENAIPEGRMHADIFICNHKHSRRKKKKGVVFQTEFQCRSGENWLKPVKHSVSDQYCLLVTSSCLFCLFFQLLFLYLTLEQRTEHSAAVDACRLTLPQLPQQRTEQVVPRSTLPCRRGQPRQQWAHYQQQGGCSQGSPAWDWSCPQRGQPHPAARRAQTLSLHDTNKADTLLQSSKNSRHFEELNQRCLSSDPDPPL